MTTKKSYSPLRYPGGKSVLAGFLKDIISINNLEGCTYCEAYAGGAGAALDLLFSRKVRRIFLNDIDFHIYTFWDAILNNSSEFIRMIRDANVDIDNWKVQQQIYLNPKQYSNLEVGFSTFFLNRCNRSGILTKAGPIGGMDQKGNYLIDARFNKNALIERIELISNFSSQIQIFNLDALEFIDQLNQQPDTNNQLLYLDPPYYNKGKTLYLNFYDHADHENIARKLSQFEDMKWVISYDNATEIHEIYHQYRTTEFDLNYSLQENRKGSELMIFSPSIIVPDFLQIGSRVFELAF